MIKKVLEFVFCFLLLFCFVVPLNTYKTLGYKITNIFIGFTWGNLAWINRNWIGQGVYLN